MGSLLNIPSILERGRPEINRLAEELDAHRDELFSDMRDPIAFIESAFSESYNKAVKWHSTLGSVSTLRAFQNREDAENCVKKLNAIGIEGCVIKPQDKGFRVEMTPRSVILAMDKPLQKTSAEPLTGNVLKQNMNKYGDPIAFIQTAFNDTYNKHVTWCEIKNFVITKKAFVKQDDADKCVTKLKSIGIEGCIIKQQEKNFNLEIPLWRIFQAMDKLYEALFVQDQQNDQNKPRSH